MHDTRVAPARWEPWTRNFTASHGPTSYAVEDGALVGRAEDGSWFRARLPYGRTFDAPAEPGAVAELAKAPDDWAVLLVRKGGFAVARLSGTALAAHKVGQRHVQGRTKAGGQSQQRFARRRDNQARQAYQAAADHAARLLPGLAGPLLTGGDAGAVEEVLADARLRDVAGHRVADEHRGDLPEPRRATLDEAVRAAQSLRVTVHNA